MSSLVQLLLDPKRNWLAPRSWFNRITANDMVYGLIIANAAVFSLWRMADKNFMINNFTISLVNFTSGRFHTLITKAFGHMDILYVVNQMMGLYFFGKPIGKFFGPEYLLKLYLAGAVGGSIFHLLHQAYKSQTSKEALNGLPKEVVDARHQRLKRAMDISTKHEYLPNDLQAMQTPFRGYLQDMLALVKKERAEREALGGLPLYQRTIP